MRVAPAFQSFRDVRPRPAKPHLSSCVPRAMLPVTFLFVAPIHTFSSEWIKLPPTGGPPPARFGHTSVYDPVSNRLIIFGGCATSACITTAPAVTLNDLWVL